MSGGAYPITTAQRMTQTNIRNTIRRQRRELSGPERKRNAARLCKTITTHPLFLHSQRIACFFSSDGEIDTSPIIDAAFKMGKQIYMPVIRSFPKNRLWFTRFTATTPLKRNCYGIPEPIACKRDRIPLQAIDIVLTPLVAFDRCGNRVGMGGGYYDRTFAYLLRRSHWQSPHLVGLAYDFQQVNLLPTNPWDVPLFGVFTNQNYQLWGNRKK